MKLYFTWYRGKPNPFRWVCNLQCYRGVTLWLGRKALRRSFAAMTRQEVIEYADIKMMDRQSTLKGWQRARKEQRSA